MVVVKLMEIRDANQGSSCQFVASLYGAKHPSGHQDTCVEIAGALLIAVKLVQYWACYGDKLRDAA